MKGIFILYYKCILKMKIKCLKRDYIVCGNTIVGEFVFSFAVPEHLKFLECIGVDFYITTGKAVCSPEDTFDVALGKKLVYKRAKLKAVNHFRMHMKAVEKDVLKVVKVVNDAFSYLKQETEYIEEYMKDFNS